MPIIVVTSINKTWRHNQLLDVGADAIWVKEGVDELRTPRESLHNIVRLLELIRRVTGASYSFLHALNQKLKALFKSIEKKEVWWLKDNKFQSASPGNVYNVDATVVQDILSDSIQLFRTYVKDITMNFLEDPRVLRKSRKRNSRQPERESEFAKMLIMRLAKIIEIVHGMTHESDHRKRVNSGLMGGYKKPKDNGKTDVDIQRGDWTGFWLYNLRNECAHHFPHIKYRLTTGENILDGRSAQNFMAFLVAYLSVADIPLLSKDKRFYFEALAGDDNHNEPFQKTIVNGDYIQQLVNAGGVNNIPSFGQFLDAYYDLQMQFYQ